MEELRSTQILDKEIQADARKKAEKVVKNAKAECEKILASVSERIENAKKEKLEKYEEKFNAFEKDQKASVPLEEEPGKISKIQLAKSTLSLGL